MKRVPDQAKIQFVLQAIRQDENLSIQCVAETDKRAERTLRRRRDKTPSRRDCTPNSMKLTKTEKEVIIQHRLIPDERGYLPRLYDVEGMANTLEFGYQSNPIRKEIQNNADSSPKVEK